MTKEILCPVHTIGSSDENGPMDFFIRYPMKLTFISRTYTLSVKKTIVSERGDVKHNDVLKKMKFNASKHVWA